jgi:hypothetical protein
LAKVPFVWDSTIVISTSMVWKTGIILIHSTHTVRSVLYTSITFFFPRSRSHTLSEHLIPCQTKEKSTEQQIAWVYFRLRVNYFLFSFGYSCNDSLASSLVQLKWATHHPIISTVTKLTTHTSHAQQS